GKLAADLRKRWNVDYDDAGAIGRRYRRHDEIGTPYCVTFDFDSLDDNAVTIRDRDTMAQERVSLDKVESYLSQNLGVLLEFREWHDGDDLRLLEIFSDPSNAQHHYDR